jgi:hypothetical protein
MGCEGCFGLTDDGNDDEGHEGDTANHVYDEPLEGPPHRVDTAWHAYSAMGKTEQPAGWMQRQGREREIQTTRSTGKPLCCMAGYVPGLTRGGAMTQTNLIAALPHVCGTLPFVTLLTKFLSTRATHRQSGHAWRRRMGWEG